MEVGTMSGQVTLPGEVPVYLDTTPLTHEDLNMSKDEVAQLVGDGLAEVVVAHEQSEKDFGNGSRTYISVKLHVNQDAQSIEAGLELANALALGYIPEARAAACEVWKDVAEPPKAPQRRSRG